MVGIGEVARARCPRRAYYSPAMEAARPRTRGRRLRRGTVERPLNARLVRVGIRRRRAGAARASVLHLDNRHASARVARAAVRRRERGDDRAVALGRVPLPSAGLGRSATGGALVPGDRRRTRSRRPKRTSGPRSSPTSGRSSSATWSRSCRAARTRPSWSLLIVTTRAPGSPLGDNASGTAALVELARGFAPQELGPDPLPQRTLVLVSTDAGSYGGAGAERFASTSPLARSAIAVVVLDGLGGTGRPRLAIAGDEPVSPARALVRTAAARVEEQVGESPSLPFVPTQLLDLGDSVRRGRAGALPRSRHRRRHPDDLGAERSGHPGRRSGHGYRGPQARAARPGDRGTPQLSRREPRRRVPDAGQPLLRRPCRKRLDGAAHARARGRPVRARARRSHRPGTAARPALQAGTSRAENATRGRAARRRS